MTDLGFKGALISGLTNGAFLDERKFWPIFARAVALDVPIYLHPAIPHEAVVKAYYDGHRTGEYPILMGAVWGFTVETATHALRLILSGVFQEYPRLKIILGHLGEALPLLLWRLEWTYNNLTKKTGIAECFRKHFYVTTSGNFSHSLWFAPSPNSALIVFYLPSTGHLTQTPRVSNSSERRRSS